MNPLHWLLPALWMWSVALGQSLPTPVAHYPFDGDADDVSGNGNHGTPVGAVLTTDRFGTPNSAYFFDGVDDYMDLTNNANFQPPLPVTIMAWVVFEDTEPQILFNNDFQQDRYQGVYMSGHRARLSCAYTDGGRIAPPHRRSKASTETMTLGQWHHVAVVIRAALDMDLYIDGRNVCGGYSGSGGSLTYVGNDGALGLADGSSLPGNANNYFHGKMDEVRFYDQALTAEQIRAIMGGYDPVALDTVLCEEESLILQAPNASAYQWTPATGLSCTNCPNPTAAPTVSTTYHGITFNAEGCPDTLLYRIEVSDCCPTTLDSALVNDISCFGANDGAFTLFTSTTAPPLQYALDGGPPQADGTFTGLGPGRYRITVVDAEACEKDTFLTLAEPEVLRLGLAGQRNPTCADRRDGHLDVQPSGGTEPYQFTVNGQDAPYSQSDLPGGNYQLRLLDANGCLDTTSLALITPPPLVFRFDSLQTVNCDGEPTGFIGLTLSGGVPPYQYRFDDQPSVVTRHADLPVDDYPLLLRDANGCELADTVRVTGVDGLFTEMTDLRGPLCAEATTGQVTVLTIGSSAPYAYAINAGDFQPGPLLRDLPLGEVVITTRDASGCLIRQAIEVRQTDTLQAQADLVAPLTQPMLLSQAQVQFRGESDLGEFFEWDFGLEGARSLAQYPSFTYPEPGEYEVILTVRDATLSCEAQDTLLVEVIPDGQVFLPNAFTPNGDGRNDRFVIGGEGLRQAELVIYSRWGREIYRSSGIPPSWDGKGQSGEPVPEGTYVFRLTATRNDGRTVKHSGTVMVLR